MKILKEEDEKTEVLKLKVAAKHFRFIFKILNQNVGMIFQAAAATLSGDQLFIATQRELSQYISARSIFQSSPWSFQLIIANIDRGDGGNS